jgi:mannose-6-phosphate isomerase
LIDQPLRLKPIFHERVWGGDRLRPGSPGPIGEAWVVYGECLIDGGKWHGRKLGEVSELAGVDLLGGSLVRQMGNRFPLLVKLLHSRDWLSVQVHPDDEQAVKHEGEGHFGKTEAWHVLEADEGARVVYGLNGNWSRADLKRLAEAGEFERALNYLPVHAGDTLFTPAGCVHAIGPGLFIYEVQQTSDITYRLYDWNRPASDGRALHLEKGLDVISGCLGSSACDRGDNSGVRRVVAECAYFTLETLHPEGRSLSLSTEHRSFHAVTATRGEAVLMVNGAVSSLGELETVVIPASAGEYLIDPTDGFSGLLARVS